MVMKYKSIIRVEKTKAQNPPCAVSYTIIPGRRELFARLNHLKHDEKME